MFCKTHSQNVYMHVMALTLGFLINGFWAGHTSSISGVWVAAAAPETIPKGGGRSPSPLGVVFWVAGAAHPLNVEDVRPAKKTCIKHPSASQSDVRLGTRVGFRFKLCLRPK